MGFQQVILSKVYFCISLAVSIILQTWTHKPFTPADLVWKKDSDLNAKNAATGFIYPIWPFDPWIFRLPSLKEILMSVFSSFSQTGFGPQAADKDPQHVLWSLLVQRHIQSSPRRSGGSPLSQQLPGRLWNHTNGQGTTCFLSSSPSPVTLS